MSANPAYDPTNIFAKIIDGDIPNWTIFETEHVLCFLDAFPVAEGHSLLIPKAKGYVQLMDMPEDVATNVLKELPRLARMVKAATGAEGINIVQNNGPASGQEVPHVHFHVIPRFEGDGKFQFAKPSPSMIEPDTAKAMLEKLKAHA